MGFYGKINIGFNGFVSEYIILDLRDEIIIIYTVAILDITVSTKDNVFTRDEINNIFIACSGKTLGQLDRFNVFHKAISNPKITGIAGDVVEQSILGMKANSRQEPDLIIDDEKIELKTTGLRKDKNNVDEFVPKEPVTITAVSIDKIVKEEDFEDSLLWHKLRHILFVYYLYNSSTTVKAIGYSEFEVLSHQFYMPTEIDRARYESDWCLVRDFLRDVQKNYEKPEEKYPLLSSMGKNELVVLDTAPKYPHPPRFRIKRKYFEIIVKRHFNQKLEELPSNYISYKQLDEKLHEISLQYRGKTIQEISELLRIPVDKKPKNLAEQIIVRMFGGESKEMSKVELFEAFGVTGKSIALSFDDGRTEDTKMCPIDFREIVEDKNFEESDFYRYFHDNTFLFFIGKETEKTSKNIKNPNFLKNVFQGFKRINFDDDFIHKNVKPVWDKIRELILTNTLRIVPLMSDGKPRYNKTGELAGAPNFPKGSDGDVFVRGTGKDSTKKPECVNGIKMYYQNLWIRGDVMVDKISKINYI